MGNRLEKADLIGGFKVGEWLAQPMRNRVSRDGEGIQVEPKVMDVLICLARHSGRTVTKDVFFEEVWEDTIVSEDVLSRCISELRRVLKDDAREPRFIETIRKTGYRLIAEVHIHEPDEFVSTQTPGTTPSNEVGQVVPSAAEEAPVSDKGRLVTWLAVGMVVVGSISLAATIIFRTVSDHSTVHRFVGPFQTVPFTSYRGLELDASLSPRGDQVAFAWDDDFTGDFDIYMKQSGAERPLRLTDSDASERFPSWSPDGLHLAFARSSDSSHAVFTIPSIGGKERKLVDFGLRRICGLAWSPDGNHLIVSAQVDVGLSAALFLVRLDSLGLEQLTFPRLTHVGDIQPEFSPDGGWLAFLRSLSSDVQDVYAMSMRTRGIRPITNDSTTVTGVDWTPDSQELVFTSGRGFMSSLWRVPLSGGEPEWIVTASLGNVLEHPSLARLGNRLIYIRRSSNANVWKLTGLGSQNAEAAPVIFSTGWDSDPSIRLDGRRLAYISDQTGRLEVWVSDLDGSNAVQLTARNGRPSTPRWSSDGRTLAFALRQGGQSDIYTVDAQGGGIVQVTRETSEDVHPTWSSDGRWIVFASDRTGRWELWRSRPDGSEPEQVTKTGAIFGYPDLEGSHLYFVKPDENGIWRQPWEGESPVADPVLEDLHRDDYASWALTRGGIYYIRRGAPNTALAFHRFGATRAVTLYDFPLTPHLQTLSASADGSEVVYTQLDEDAGDIQMIDSFE